MDRQGALFIPTAQGEQPAETVQSRLLHRRDDPVTSKAGAQRILRNGKPKNSLTDFLIVLEVEGPMTVRQASQHTDRPDYWFHEWEKRVHGWHVAGHIELTGEARDGGRVWRIRT